MIFSINLPCVNQGIEITSSGWPWQVIGNHWANTVDGTTGEKYGWNPLSTKGMGRFGGGWAFIFGIQISGSFRTWIFNLGIGSVKVSLKKVQQ